MKESYTFLDKALEPQGFC